MGGNKLEPGWVPPLQPPTLNSITLWRQGNENCTGSFCQTFTGHQSSKTDETYSKDVCKRYLLM